MTRQVTGLLLKTSGVFTRELRAVKPPSVLTTKEECSAKERNYGRIPPVVNLMKIRTLFSVFALVAGGSQAQEKPLTRAQLDFFEKKIRPVLVQQCYKCHSAKSEKIKGELLLDTKAGIRKGGETGPAVVPRNLRKSLLIEAVRWGNDDL
ncbi:MAG: c-type cytochrome domain-containing protein [Verrucomicrobiia bacterium]